MEEIRKLEEKLEKIEREIIEYKKEIQKLTKEDKIPHLTEKEIKKYKKEKEKEIKQLDKDLDRIIHDKHADDEKDVIELALGINKKSADRHNFDKKVKKRKEMDEKIDDIYTRKNKINAELKELKQLTILLNSKIKNSKTISLNKPKDLTISLEKDLISDFFENLKKIKSKKGKRELTAIIVSQKRNQVMLFYGNNMFKFQDFFDKFNDIEEILVFEDFEYEIMSIKEFMEKFETELHSLETQARKTKDKTKEKTKLIKFKGGDYTKAQILKKFNKK
jgi:hypothetical protein